MSIHDAFISYAVEDNDFAAKIAHTLQANGLSVWFAPLNLTVGDKLLDSIEKGLKNSRSGILVLTKQYLNKKWTSHEMDILIRQHVESGKLILPIWLGVDKKQIEERHITLSGIIGISETKDFSFVVSKLVKALSNGAANRGVIPSWEKPEYRFLQGLGEIRLQSSDGPVTTIYEHLLYGKPSDFPLWLAGELYSIKDLLCYVVEIIGTDPERVKQKVGEDGFEKLWNMCVASKLNPNDFY
uniref:toll/interleukin-1 receptor domain-containing protein n=1 Tax=Candidatus Electronema sp. TaxID=2698783 RepID=UPI004055A306